MITAHDLFIIGFLIFLEGILSIDNALVLAMQARELPKELQKKALTYGLVGAIVFRLGALSIITQLLAWNWVKFVGGGYLIAISLKHFLTKQPDPDAPPKKVGAKQFWRVVVMIELTDIAFALDSILAAVAVTNKFWIIFTGGILGVILMRFAASIFLRILTRFPGFESTAYLLVLTIGAKLVLEGFKLPGVDFHSAQNPAFWIFWGLMAACIGSGFIKRGTPSADESNETPSQSG